MDFFNSFKRYRRLRRVRELTDHRVDIRYAKNTVSELSRLCELHGSDKGRINQSPAPYSWPSHNYADFYEMLFAHCRNTIGSILECGLGTNNPDVPSSMGINGRPGASLRVWRDYFPDANVVGIDIDPNILFSEERITTFQVDQTSKESITAFLEKIGDRQFDIIIDDGLHEFSAGLCLFDNTIARLAEHGVYLIEDVSQIDLSKYAAHFAKRADTYDCRYVSLYRPALPLGGNSIVMITKKQLPFSDPLKAIA